MRKTHWKQLVNTDYLGAYALKDGEDMVLTIKSVRQEMVTGNGGKKESCTVAHFAETGVKPMILNRTNMKTITKLYKSPYIEDWAGKRIQVYQTTTKLAGETVECLRIRDFIPRASAQDKTPRCASCQAELTGYGKMNALQLADYTLRKYGKALCGECAEAAAKTSAPEGGAPDAE